jgi:hypothetical protein
VPSRAEPDPQAPFGCQSCAGPLESVSALNFASNIHRAAYTGRKYQTFFHLWRCVRGEKSWPSKGPGLENSRVFGGQLGRGHHTLHITLHNACVRILHLVLVPQFMSPDLSNSTFPGHIRTGCTHRLRPLVSHDKHQGLRPHYIAFLVSETGDPAYSPAQGPLSSRSLRYGFTVVPFRFAVPPCCDQLPSTYGAACWPLLRMQDVAPGPSRSKCCPSKPAASLQQCVVPPALLSPRPRRGRLRHLRTIAARTGGR